MKGIHIYTGKIYSTTIRCFDDTTNKNIHPECIFLNQTCVKKHNGCIEKRVKTQLELGYRWMTLILD